MHYVARHLLGSFFFVSGTAGTGKERLKKATFSDQLPQVFGLANPPISDLHGWFTKQKTRSFPISCRSRLLNGPSCSTINSAHSATTFRLSELSWPSVASPGRTRKGCSIPSAANPSGAPGAWQDIPHEFSADAVDPAVEFPPRRKTPVKQGAGAHQPCADRRRHLTLCLCNTAAQMPHRRLCCHFF